MDGKLQRLDIAFTLRHLSPAKVRGYHAWAVPYVRLMKRSALATHLIEPFARWRAEEIAYQMGARKRANWKGKGVRGAGEPICWALGTVLGWWGAPDRLGPNSRNLSGPAVMTSHQQGGQMTAPDGANHRQKKFHNVGAVHI